MFKLSKEQVTLIQIVLGILVVIALYYMFNKPTGKAESLEDIEGNPLPDESSNIADINDSLAPQVELDLATEEELSLLPKYDESDQFARDHPVTALLRQQNYLIGGHHNGINSTLQSNKIPYLDIRELPPIIKEDVGPWNNSSYEQAPGAQRRGFSLN